LFQGQVDGAREGLGIGLELERMPDVQNQDLLTRIQLPLQFFRSDARELELPQKPAALGIFSEDIGHQPAENHDPQ